MINWNSGYVGISYSRERLRLFAQKVRDFLDIPQDELCPDVIRCLEELAERFGYDVIVVDKMAVCDFAYTDVLNKEIYLRRSIYDGACRGDGFSRMTVMHEVFHMLFHHPAELRKLLPGEKIRNYQKTEWQADCFAGEFLIPYVAVGNLGIWQIEEECQVTEQAAAYAKNHYRYLVFT